MQMDKNVSFSPWNVVIAKFSIKLAEYPEVGFHGRIPTGHYDSFELWATAKNSNEFRVASARIYKCSAYREYLENETISGINNAFLKHNARNTRESASCHS